MSSFRVFFPLIIINYLVPCKAEYRAYLLEIKNTETEQVRQVITTLDHIQYPQYHHLKAKESISLVDHWMCWERSDHFTPICLSPRQKEEEGL